MPTISPHTAALFIVLAVALLGAIVAYLRDRARFRGYEDLARESLRLARAVKGEVFRDGADLVASGSWNELPVHIRFSHATNTPGLDIRMGAPAGFSLAVMPARSSETAGTVRVRTPDEIFNTRFVVRSNDPTQARLFIGDRQVMACLQKLCQSSQNFLLFSTGLIEFGELSAPNEQSARTSIDHLETLGRLAQKLCAMPGAQAIKLEKLKRSRAWAVKLALAVGIIASIAGLTMDARRPASPKRESAPAQTGGVSPAEAKLIPGLANWHLAELEQLDRGALSWVRGQHGAAESRIEGDFCAPGRGKDVAYLLTGTEPARRLVLLCDGENVYDSKYSYIGIAVRVPKQRISSIQWSVKPPELPEGDGLLITRAPDDPASGLVLFARGHRILTGVPLNYQTVRLE